MRRVLFLLAPLGLAALSFACEDDPAAGPSTNIPEAGTFDSDRPDFDSSTPPDAQPDAPSTPKGVTVIATRRTGPAASVTVLFHDATGTITETKKTGADGKATSIPTPTPAMATVVFGEGTLQRQLVTWTGVADGDELPALMPEDVNLGTVTVTLPGALDAGTFNYDGYVGDCYGYGDIGDDPFDIFPYTSCARGGGALLVVARDVNTQQILGFSFKRPITLDTDGGALPVTPGAWVAPTNVTLSVSNATSFGTGIFSQIAGNTVFSTRTNLDDAHAATFQGAGPTFADGYNIAAAFNGATPNNSRIIGRRVATSTTSVTFDANTLPPELTAASLDQTDKRRPIAKWTGSTAGLKGGIVRLHWYDYMSDGASTSWTIVVPAGGAEVKVPALPASLDAILPDPDGGQSSWDSVPTVAFADSTLLPDYRTFRAIQGLVFPGIGQDAQVQDAVLPQAGDFKITSWYVSLDR